MAIITTDIFANHFNLVIDDGPTKAAVEQAIAQYEAEYLAKLLGMRFGQLFVDGLQVNVGGGFSALGFSSGWNTGGIQPRWQWLADGHTFTINGLPYDYKGVKNGIAAYVYYWYRRNNATNTDSTGGESAGTFENSTMQAANIKMATAWNRIAAESRSVQDVLLNAVTDDGVRVYPEYQLLHCREVFRHMNPFGL